jgi:hypothetical protein
VLGFVSPAMLGLAMGTILGVLNLLATARDPLEDDSVGGMLLFVIPVLLAWSAAGFVAAQRTPASLTASRPASWSAWR